jgi:exosortase K
MRTLAALVTLGGGFWLKLTYSRAGADELSWVLGPSAWVAQLAGVALVPEPGAGFISRSAHMVVGPACAGVNFLLTCWLALYFCAQSDLRRARLRELLGVSVLCLVAAYLITISINGLRIALAARLLSLDIYGALWTKARAHRLLGVGLYTAALLGACLVAQRLQSQTTQTLPAARRLSVALCLYLGVSLGIPVLNRAFVRHPAHFAEHAALTLGGALTVALLFLTAHRLYSRSRSNTPEQSYRDRTSSRIGVT